MKYKCSCGNEKTVHKVRTTIVDGKLQSNVICSCGKEMTHIKEHDGFPSSGVAKGSSNPDFNKGD